MMSSDKRFWIALVACPAILGIALAIDVLLIPARVLTPFHDHLPLSPLYAFWMPVPSLRILRPLVVAAGYVVWVWYAGRSAPATAIGWLGRIAVHMIWLGLFAVFLAAIRLPLVDLGASMRIYPGEDFWDDVPHVNSPGQFMRDFASLHRHDRLSLHGKTHPPGHTLFLWCVTELFGRRTQAAALSILVAGATGLVPLVLLARRLFGDRVAGRVLALYPVVPSVAMFSVSATDFLFAGIAAWSLWLAVEAVLGRHAWLALCAGLVGGFAALFSVAEVFVGLIVALFAVATWIDRPGTRVGWQCGWMFGGLVFWFVALRVLFGFDFVECLRLTRGFHHSFIKNVVGGMTLGNWLYTSFGNLVAFGWYLGISVTAAASLSALASIRERLWETSIGSHFARAFWIVLAFMTIGGIFVLEVERIWLFLVGPLVACACGSVAERDSAAVDARWTAGMAAALCLQSALYETLLFTIW